MDRRWVILGTLFLARTAMGFQFQSIASTASFLADSLNIDYALIGTLIGLYFLPGIAISLPGGLIMRRLGDKAVCAAGLTLMVLGGLLLGMAHDFSTAVCGRLLSGTGSILFNLVITKMTADWFAGREIVFAMGAVLASWPFGIAVGLVTQRSLAVAFGWPAVMDATAALGAVALTLVAVLYTSPPRTEALSAGAAEPNALAVPPWRQAAPVSVAGVIWANANIGLVLFFSFAPDLLNGFGLSPGRAHSIPGTALWIIMFSLPLGGYAIERLGKPNGAIVICCVLSAAALAMLAADIAPALQCLAFGIVMGLPAGAVMALPARVLDSNYRAAGFGLFFTIYYGLMALGPAVGGWLLEWTDAPASPIVLAAVLFLAIPFLLLAFRGLERGAPISIPVGE